MNHMKVFILRGCPASGKSTWRQQKVEELEVAGIPYHVSNMDFVRREFNVRGYAVDDTTSLKEFEKRVKEESFDRIRAFIRGKASENTSSAIILDNTNLSDKSVKRFVQVIDEAAKLFDVQVEYKEVRFFDVPYDKLVRRDAEREAPVGEKVIKRFWKMQKRLISDENNAMRHDHSRQVELRRSDPKTTQAIIVDLDGTLALRSPRRGWYDNHKVDLDSVNTSVEEALLSWIFYQQHKGVDWKVYFFSGRENIPIGNADGIERYDGYNALRKTADWIRHHVIRDHLSREDWDKHVVVKLRAHGDHRPDDAVKAEMADTIPRGTNVHFVLDDRNQVVDMWRARGWDCFQVAPGDF